METVTHESKSAAIKTLAIIGFIAAIIAGLWIAVQAVRFAPTAFSSLASIADSLYGKDVDLTLNASKNVVNAGESLTLTFAPMRNAGTYTFSYRCVDGIAAETRSSGGDIVKFDCGEEVEVITGRPTGEQTVDVLFTSEKKRFSDVPYTLSFYKTGVSDPAFETSGVATVVNATIPERALATTDQKPTVVSTPTQKPAATNSATPTPTAKKPVAYTKVPVEKVAYATSNPSGYTDLEVILVGVGTSKANARGNEVAIDADTKTAVQFIVKNIGTKTSNAWLYRILFPGADESEFRSFSQAPLMPGERAIITMSFLATEKRGAETIKVSVAAQGETNLKNNTDSIGVKVVR